jgi:putative nucleotidyltransferase with HDIG domain
MWPFKKTPRQRRLEAQRPASPAGPLRERFRKAGGLTGLLLAGLLVAAAAAMDLWPLDPFAYRAGQYLPADVHSRVRFRVPSRELIEEAKRSARRVTPAVFVLDADSIDRVAGELLNLPRRIGATSRPADLAAEIREGFALADANDLAAWRMLADDPNAAKAHADRASKLAAQLRGLPVVDLTDPQGRKPLWRRPLRAVLEAGGVRTDRDVSGLIDVADGDSLARQASRLSEPFDPPVRNGVQAQLLRALAARPIYRYDPKATQQLMDAAVEAVEANPPDDVYRDYEIGERIAMRTVRPAAGGGEMLVGLTPADLAVLRAEHAAFRADARVRPMHFWGRAAGRVALIVLIVALMGVYVARYEHGLPKAGRRALALLATLVLALVASRVLVGALLLNRYVALLPVMMVAAVVTVAWDQRFALAVAAAVALLVVLQVRGEMELLLVSLAGAATLIFQLDEIRTRTKLIGVAAACAVAVFVAVWLISLAAAVPWLFALADAVWAAGCALLVGFVAQGILPLIERVFLVATSLTLLEWCDASRPLLRRLAMAAPGTYNHSLQLGALCESAADAVGARGLLARVGAYYHDIGKINKPDYFVENQTTTASKHEKLSPAMSLLIIIGHVKDGIEMAREYGLPNVLREFIATHHGTTLVQYFYQAATEQRKSDTDRAPDEVEFRYPGPKPQSEEPAILMLADAAESSVRAMKEPTSGRIENQVHTMVSRRLMDGQLDECDLTLRQVHQIETSLIKSLCSMYHSRIAYPTPAGQKPSAGEREARAAEAAANGDTPPDEAETQTKADTAPAK